METQLILRFREVFLDGKWIANTNYKAILADVDWKQANQRVGSLNTIALLTFHINYYVEGILQVFEGGTLDIRDRYSFDMPEIKTEAEWLALRDRLASNAEKFARYLEEMPAGQLEAPFVDEKYGDYRRNIDGMIEHSYYHLGQISLIKKLIAEQ